jgi:hypothetical protein
VSNSQNVSQQGYFLPCGGVSGGQGTWRQHFTLPNVLKLYNSNLTGFSLGDGLSHTYNAQMNVAVNGAMDQDLPFEAVELVRRMRANPKIDFMNHWKVIMSILEMLFSFFFSAAFTQLKHLFNPCYLIVFQRVFKN